MKISFALLVVMSLCAGVLGAQEYPSKPIRLVASVAGSGTDFIARLLAQALAGPMGQPVIVENQGGALTHAIVSKSAPDGHTLSVSGPALWMAPLLRRMPPDVVKEFSPVTLVSREILMVAVHPSLPVTSVKDLITLAKARPGELNFGSGVVGSTSHLAVELLKAMAEVNLVHVPYKGTGQAMPALIRGEIQLLITDLGLLTPHVKGAKSRRWRSPATNPLLSRPACRRFPPRACLGTNRPE